MIIVVDMDVPHLLKDLDHKPTNGVGGMRKSDLTPVDREEKQHLHDFSRRPPDIITGHGSFIPSNNITLPLDEDEYPGIVVMSVSPSPSASSEASNNSEQFSYGRTLFESRCLSGSPLSDPGSCPLVDFRSQVDDVKRSAALVVRSYSDGAFPFSGQLSPRIQDLRLVVSPSPPPSSLRSSYGGDARQDGQTSGAEQHCRSWPIKPLRRSVRMLDIGLLPDRRVPVLDAAPVSLQEPGDAPGQRLSARDNALSDGGAIVHGSESALRLRRNEKAGLAGGGRGQSGLFSRASQFSDAGHQSQVEQLKPVSGLDIGGDGLLVKAMGALEKHSSASAPSGLPRELEGGPVQNGSSRRGSLSCVSATTQSSRSSVQSSPGWSARSSLTSPRTSAELVSLMPKQNHSPEAKHVGKWWDRFKEYSPSLWVNRRKAKGNDHHSKSVNIEGAPDPAKLKDTFGKS